MKEQNEGRVDNPFFWIMTGLNGQGYNYYINNPEGNVVYPWFKDKIVKELKNISAFLQIAVD